VLTFGDIKFRSVTLNVVQPDRSTTGTVRVTDKLSNVSARIVVNHDLITITVDIGNDIKHSIDRAC